MNGWITRVPVAVGAMLLLAAAGCGDAPGVDGHSCSYTCPGSEVVHPASLMGSRKTPAEASLLAKRAVMTLRTAFEELECPF